MKIFESDQCCIYLESQKKIVEKTKTTFLCPDRFNLIVCGKGKIIWPNREGECFNIKNVYSALEKTGFLKEGISIAWPATASFQALLFLQGLMFFTNNNCSGRHREIRIFAENTQKIHFLISGKACLWQLKKIDTSLLKNTKISQKNILPSYQFQLGMKDTMGISYSKEGFNLIKKLVNRFSKNFNNHNGFPNILHLFAYAAGHDLGYPNYSPAIELGGQDGLKKAAEIIHKKEFILSCYLNARIAQKEALETLPKLLNERCFYSNGDPVIEKYHNRTFFVMNPNSKLWQEHIFTQAMMLKQCGADAVQLDQVAGRAPVVEIGQIWGSGYKELINKLSKEGLKVWIQGVTDYYPADWFEMTQRELKILKGGVLRGGNPFGKTDISFIKLMQTKTDTVNKKKQEKRYIIPLSKVKNIKDFSIPFIIDILGSGGNLPVYNKNYLNELELLEKSEINIYN